MHKEIRERLGPEDDPTLWEAVLAEVFAGLAVPDGYVIEVGRCSHWLRPHQTRWSADGGFAWPTGYGGGAGGYSRLGLPQRDWAVALRRLGDRWMAVLNGLPKFQVRITIPSRTRRHRQAAIHVLWRVGKEKRLPFFGFRNRPEGWRSTASRPETVCDPSLLPTFVIETRDTESPMLG